MVKLFKRKIYSKLVEWKNRSNGETAILIEGARRIGKTSVAKEFAYLMIYLTSISFLRDYFLLLALNH